MLGSGAVARVRNRRPAPTSLVNRHRDGGGRERETPVKYMIMLYGSQRDYDAMAGHSSDRPAMTAEQVAAMHAHMGKVHQDLADAGELVDAQGLTAPVHARRVQLRDGTPMITDGPYPETQEVLAGYTVVECASFDRAVEIAATLVNPDNPGEYVDVRPVAEGVDDLA
ncbi:hypothetical protein Vlu01_43610 [Micromonospora lutea]|uniref:YCII-related domain-containing protein n=2 Tax=Micromonospora lutea TaxID=419825 RepID=A0ABQ4J0N9_9ACTN|nr:hypothetical protein Vlu01_43610 [Micromonospora lutea]